MRSFTIEERRARLARRHFLTEDHPDASIADLTGALIGWHATDPATPYLSLWARLPGFTVADLDVEMYEKRSLVKQLAMRRTLWLVQGPHLAILQPGASDRVADTERRRLIADVEKAGVAADGARWVDTACAAVLRHLGRHGHANSKELRAAIPELAGSFDPAPGKPWGGATPLAPRVLTVLSVRGDVVRGPNEGSWTNSRHRWVGTADWWNGRIVGGWYQDADARVQLQLLDDPGRDGKKALRRRADELTAWANGVRVSARFPSPLSKSVKR